MTADLTITGYEHRALRVPERPVGDSQTHVFETDAFDYLYLELETDADAVGIGVDLIELRAPGRPSPETLESRVEAVVGDAVGESAFSLLTRQTRHRGGVHNYHESGSYGPGVGVTLDMALWDACAKHVGQPLHEFMGGTDDSVPVYASGLSFVNDDERTREVYERFADLGAFDAAKVKVGHETVEADIERLELVAEVMDGPDRLMVDPNEAWSPTETLRRLSAFEAAGVEVFWVEDPVFRHDRDGLRRVVENTPGTHVTVGEYQGFEAKRSLLEAGACDVLNLQGLTAARRAGTLAQARGTPVAISTDHATDAMAVHAGLALPDVVAVECCYHRLFDLAAEPPYTVEDGEVRATDRPGHGVAFEDDTLAEYTRRPKR
ncbi:MAG: mandelate racemase/muconate lactonizing enzyme family protein [Halobacteriales archaeon]